MLPEQRGLLTSWFSSLRSKRGAPRRANQRKRNVARARQFGPETLEPRQLLTATLYVDFGDFMPSASAMAYNDSTTATNGSWATLGYAPPAQPGGAPGVNWITGPQFQFGTHGINGGIDNSNRTVSYTSLVQLVQNLGFVYTPSADFPDQNDPFQFEVGKEAPVDPDPVLAGEEILEFETLSILNRMFAPFNISVQEAASTGLGAPARIPTTPAGYLARNNPLIEPNTFDPANPPMTPQALAMLRGAQFDPMRTKAAAPATPTGYRDAYILVGGWVDGKTNAQVGVETGSYATSGGADFTTVFNDPAYDDPTLPMHSGMQLSYQDGGGAVFADTIINRLLSQNDINLSVALATAIAQSAAGSFGLVHTSDGLASSKNPFFDPNVNLLSSSDIMREGPETNTSGVPQIPTMVNIPFFNRFNLMQGDLNEDPAVTQNAYTVLATNTDQFGPNTGAIGNGLVLNDYISGTGARDDITVTRINANTSSVLVNSFDDSGNLLGSLSYTINTKASANPQQKAAILVELGRSDDTIHIDPALSSIEFVVFGGQGSDDMSVVGNGSANISVTPFGTNPHDYDHSTQFDTALQIGAGATSTIILTQEFDQTSTIHVEGFNSMTYTPPPFLGVDDDISLTHSGAMVISGTAGPTSVSPQIGFANIEFTDVTTLNISIPIGNTNDSLTFNTIDPQDPTTRAFANGLQNVSVDLGPGDDSLTIIGTIDLPGTFTYNGGTGTDSITVDDATDWTLTDSGLTDGTGHTITFVGNSVEVADITGEADPIFSVQDWSGDVTLTGVSGGDVFNVGTVAGVTGNVTINANGFVGDTFNIGSFSGVGVFEGSSGDDIFNINTTAVTLSNAATGTGTAAAYMGPSVSIKTTAGSNVIKVVSGVASNLAIGNAVIGPNIPAGATVIGISGTNITISAAATGSGTNTTVYGVIGGSITQVQLATTNGKKSAKVVGNYRFPVGQAIVGNANIASNTSLIAVSNLIIDGNDGDDSFYIKSWNGVGDVHGDAGNDSFFIGTLSTSSPSGDGVIQAITRQHNILGDAGNDTLTLDDSGNNSAANYTVLNKTVTDNSNLFGGLGFDVTLENLKLIGSQGANTFDVTPDMKTAINVDGVLPTTSPGDTLIVNVTGTKGAKFVPNGPNGGTLSFTSGQKPITFSHIETTIPDLTQIATAQQLQEQSDLLANLLAKMANDPLLVVAGEAGSTGAPLVKVYDVHNGTNSLLFSFSAYEAGFKGGVRATIIPDIDAIPDGIPDIVVAPGSGRLGEVKVYSGALLAAGAATGGTHVISNPDLALLSGASLVPVNTTAGSNVATLPIVGLGIDGPNIAGGTTVSSINNTTTIGLSQAATGTGTVTATIGGNIVVTLKTTVGKTTATVSSIVSIGGLVVGQSVAGSNQVNVTTTLGSKVLSVATTVGLGLFVGEPVSGLNIPGNAIVTAIGSNTITISSPAIGSGGTVATFDPVASNTTATAFKLTLGGITITLSNKVNSTTSLNSLFAAGFLPEAPTYKGGIYVAAGDLNGDGSIQIVTSRSNTVPNVEVFNASDLLIGNTTPITKFNPYTSKYLTGAQIAVGDVDGDTQAEIVTAPGSGQSALVEVFNYDEVQTQLSNNLPVIAARSFLGFEAKFKNGVSLTVGDFDGPDVNGAVDQIAVGTGANGTSRVRIFDEFGTQLAPEFKAFTTSANSPLRIQAVNDPNSGDADRRAILFVGQANAARSHVIEEFKFTPAGLGLAIDGSFVDTLVESDPAMTNGVFLG